MMKKLKPWLVIALVFVAGFAAGVVVTRGVTRRFVQTAVNNPDRVRDLIERRMTARLRLDAEQRTKVHGILVESQMQLRELRGEFAPRFEQILTNAAQQISATLTEEQRVRFEQFRAENRQLWQPHAQP
ncbi:MAG: hypothetical protein RLY20_2687 [Verrucomicrobiota bacterium]|jgi:hypothetical protein